MKRCLILGFLIAATSFAADVPLGSDAHLHEIVVDGEIRDVLSTSDGVLVLHDELTLWRIGEEPRIVELDLPEDAEALASVELGGEDALLLGAPGRIFRLRLPAENKAASLESLLEIRGLDLQTLEERGLLADGFVAAVELDRLRRFAWKDGAFAEIESYDLPLNAERISTGIVLSSPPTNAVDSTLFAGPENAGPTRLRTVRLGDESVDHWSRFRGPEEVQQSWYRSHNGEPILIVATRRADQMGVFEKLKVRVFRLRADRTRAGVGPSLEFETKNIWWYPLRIDIRDLDGDGKEDLSILQSEGMGGGKLVLTVFRGRSTSGGFETLELESTIKPGDANAAWGDDLDGDDKPDAVIRAGRTVSIHRGELNMKKRRVASKKPSTEWTLPRSPIGGNEDDVVRHSRPRVEDLDGDGRLEIFFLGEIRREGDEPSPDRGIVRVIRLLR